MAITEKYTDAKTIKILMPASTAIARGTLLWNNAGVAAKASAQTDQLTQAANQRLFAQKFLGIMKDDRLATETDSGTTSERVVSCDGVFDATCASTTWAIGDLIGAVEASSGTALEDTTVAKVTDRSLAIGVCIAAATSATTVRGRFLGNYQPEDLNRLPMDQMTQTAVTDTATITAAQLLARCLDGTPTGAATYTLPTSALLVAAMPRAAVGDSFTFLVNNKSGGANTITVAAGSGGTGDGTLTVAQNVIRQFTVIITSITSSSEAYFVYGHG